MQDIRRCLCENQTVIKCCVFQRESSDETFYRRKIKKIFLPIKNYILLIYDVK